MNYIEIKAPAKINIGLDILSRRNDGYHNLSTLFYPLNDLYDILKFSKSDKFEFICSDNTLGDINSNLVVKAKNILESYSKKEIKIKIELIKNIPSQAGLGGGSSDAAATLISLNEFLNLNIKYEQLLDIALSLGSDVPFFLKAKPAIGTSRGEMLEHVFFEISEPILIINPRINISTKEAFQNINPSNTPTHFVKLIKDGKLNLIEGKSILKNDFEKYVFDKYPEISKIKQTMYEYNASLSLMSGSGSTVFGIFQNVDDAKKALSNMRSDYFNYLCNIES
jgi:4-diphosphocytidyl-2-C-methyl-D-erythritol kinase